jgi:hypothetical protein
VFVLAELVPLIDKASDLTRGHIVSRDEDGVLRVELAQGRGRIDCLVLHPGANEASFDEGDSVLVWLGDGVGFPGVVLGRLGTSAAKEACVVPEAQFASRPETVLIEAKGDLILRNGKARITIGAEGDIEIACASFVSRSRRLLRLLAPLIKLN